MRIRKKSTIKRLLAVVLVLIFSVVFIVWVMRGNTRLEINEYVIESARLPKAFSGYRIAQVSDLHNAEFGKDNAELLTKLEGTGAEAIVLTGDLVDSRRTDVNVALRFAEAAVDIAPTYYVTGNHEERIEEYVQFKEGLLACGVTVLENEAVTVKRNDAQIRFIGLKDPACVGEWDDGVEGAYIKAQLALFEWETEYTVLLSHRPEYLTAYSEAGADLVFSGHAHGGQFRLPWIGGVFAPDQGFFPKYDGGLYEAGQTKMLLSRGIGNSLFPFRVNNNPEIVVAELKKI